MPAPVQDIVPSFISIPGPSGKIEAQSASEINFLHMIGEENRTRISSLKMLVGLLPQLKLLAVFICK